MKQHLILALGAAAVLTTASSAQAQEQRWPRWYVGLSGSVAYLTDADMGGATSAGSTSFDNPGWGAAVQLGYTPPFGGIMSNMRFELEAAYRANDADVAPPGSGNVSSQAYMINAYYDIPTSSQWTPYVGAGIGWSRVNWDVNVPLFSINSSDTVFAYQLMAGVGYSPVTMPMTVWTLGYRWFSSQDPEFSSPSGKITAEQSYHNLEAGVKFRF